MSGGGGRRDGAGGKHLFGVHLVEFVVQAAEFAVHVDLAAFGQDRPYLVQPEQAQGRFDPQASAGAVETHGLPVEQADIVLVIQAGQQVGDRQIEQFLVRQGGAGV